MKKLITFIAALLTVYGELSPALCAEETVPPTSCSCSVPYPEHLDPRAAITGANYGYDMAYLGLGVVVVAGIAILVITSSHGSNHHDSAKQ